MSVSIGGRLNRYARRVYLRKCRVGKINAAFERRPSCRAIGTHSIGGEEEYVSVTTRSQYNSVSGVTFYLARYHIADYDTACFAVHYYQIEHFMAVVRGYLTFSHLALESGVASQKELLSCLSCGVERARYLGAAERTVVQLSAVVAGERHSLCHALVYDMSGYFGQTVNVCLAGTVVTAFNGVVEQAESRVAVVRVVLVSVDTSLCGYRVRAAGGVLVENAFTL